MPQANRPMKGFPSLMCSAARLCQVSGGDVALNSLLRDVALNLKLPLSYRTLKQLKCMAKLRVSFLWT